MRFLGERWIKIAAFLLVTVSPIAVGCSDRIPGSKLYIVGDSRAVGAEIYLDGERIGVMERRIYSAPRSSKQDELAAHAEARQRLGLAAMPPLKPGDVFAEGVGDAAKQAGARVYDQVRAGPGPHELAFVHRDGRRLVKRIEVRSEVYIGVDFSEMRITGGD